MKRGSLTLLAFISTVLFPWPITVLFVLASAIFVPLLPLAIGLFIDVLYYTPAYDNIPVFTLYGAMITIFAFFVRSRFKTGIIN